MVWDPAASKVISAKNHKQNIDFNIFEGMKVTGLASHTISGGQLRYKNSELMTRPGTGSYIKRPAFQPMFHALEKIAAANKPKPVKRM